MRYDAHIHMALDGANWKAALAAHQDRPRDTLIRERLAAYQAAGVTWLRDGGDRWNVSVRASQLAPEYGITYRTPAFPLYAKGRYGGFIGRGFGDLAEYQALLREVARQGGHFVKLMLSGLMDFDCYGVLTDPPMEPERIQTLIAMAHDAGFAVMAHCNGAQTICAAIAAGVDSVEHGAYLDEATAQAMAESGAVWVPTLSAIGNLVGDGRSPDAVLRQILGHQMAMVRRVFELGGRIACGSDAGAYRVCHAQGLRTEEQYLRQAMGENAELHLEESARVLQKKF